MSEISYTPNRLHIHTLRMAGVMELGPLEEKVATLVEAGFPTSVLDGFIFTVGDLSSANRKPTFHIISA